METKIWKFPHKIYHNSACIEDTCQNFAPNWGFWGVGQSNEVIQIFATPTLVAMVTKIGRFCQKIGYNSACV